MLPMFRAYEMSPHTGRDASMLAADYGFGNVDDLARRLPDEATVVDVGAGLSPFGCTIAALRPDITWINTDRRYPDIVPWAQDRYDGDPPSNVKYVKDDIVRTQLPPAFADLVFSSALLPHIIMSSRRRGL